MTPPYKIELGFIRGPGVCLDVSDDPRAYELMDWCNVMATRKLPFTQKELEEYIATHPKAKEEIMHDDRDARIKELMDWLSRHPKMQAFCFAAKFTDEDQYTCVGTGQVCDVAKLIKLLKTELDGDIQRVASSN